VTRRLLLAAAVLSLAWAATIVAAPRWLQGTFGPARLVALASYVIGSRVCHQDAARSFSVGGVPLPVCARCTGLHLGVPLGILAGLVATPARKPGERRAARWIVLAAAPTLLTVLVERAGIAPVPGGLRAILGIVLSATAAFVVTTQVRAEARAAAEVN
jgi:uncharacterized membrane protein